VAGLHFYFTTVKKRGRNPRTLSTPTYIISVFSNYDPDSYDTDGQKVMRMGFGGEN